MSEGKKDTAGGEPKPVMIEGIEGETEAESSTRVLTDPFFRHGLLAKGIIDKSLGKLPGNPQFDGYARALQCKASKAATGDLKFATEMLTSQANSLDAMFAEFARRAALNMGDYINAAESYARMALKAQSNCRATLEALMKLHQPREQIVKHVHVNEGGQAVVADHFHAGSQENGKSSKQSHAAVATGECAALSRPNAERDGMPIPSRSRKAALQDARRDQSRSA